MMGYSSLYLVQNFGMLCFTLFLPFIARFFAPLAKFIPKKEIFKIDYEVLQTDAKNWLQYGFWISFLEETYLFLFVCSGLNLRYYFEWQTAGDGANSLFALFFGIILLIFPFFVSIFYSLDKNYTLIEKNDTDFKARFGSIIEGLNFKRRQRWALFYPCLSLFRKMWLAYILVF
jgi:hypothetical protein